MYICTKKRLQSNEASKLVDINIFVCTCHKVISHAILIIFTYTGIIISAVINQVKLKVWHFSLLVILKLNQLN